MGQVNESEMVEEQRGLMASESQRAEPGPQGGSDVTSGPGPEPPFGQHPKRSAEVSPKAEIEIRGPVVALTGQAGLAAY
jgi:hypothetical protein